LDHDSVAVVFLSDVAGASFHSGCVEIGHQLVVIPLFVVLKSVRKTRATEDRVPDGRILKFGSAAISLAGIYSLIQAIR
jgi:hypothetical protein